MEHRALNLLDEALGLDDKAKVWPLGGRVVLVEDCVETTGSFVLHQVLKRCLTPQSPSVVVFVAFSQPFSNYDRILRKLGCNLAAQRDNRRFVFIDMLMLQCPDACEDGLVPLYEKIEKVTCGLAKEKATTIFIDDISLLEVAANGSSNNVLDFLHYCLTLTSEHGCSLVALNHEDIYLNTERPTLSLQLEYLADILVKAEPLATGLATDVHGQLTVLNKETWDGQGSSRNRICNFHFKVKENSVEYFYPGSRA
ncbi:elongator complex protein 6 [Quillaja saponaria]|uniref:Elongator complex protein 6 n=1 Tax=Quillaja saponaria TaxID=32244 RepID=A0AAD7KNT5_QUISA|nr:elongator complex protein 6 [Quillaja saponaria]KAJ7942903.1 elongator complex protein 6 [Quillaja saponaria]